jgi:hypothetical protein
MGINLMPRQIVESRSLKSTAPPNKRLHLTANSAAFIRKAWMVDALCAAGDAGR